MSDRSGKRISGAIIILAGSVLSGMGAIASAMGRGQFDLLIIGGLGICVLGMLASIVGNTPKQPNKDDAASEPH